MDVKWVLIALIVVLIIAQAVYANTFGRGRDLAKYREDHPEHFRGGKVFCFQCDSSNIYLRRIGEGLGHILNSHVCRQCGAELYRSKTKAT